MSPKENRTYRTQAVVLSHIEYGEADRILKLFTLEKGKISVIAKGVRKIRSRKAGHLEPFTLVQLFLAKGRNLDIVTQAETITLFTELKEDLRLLGLAAYIVEVLDRFTYEEGQNTALFRLLTTTLSRLESHPRPKTVVHYYELRLLDLLGFRPQLFTCIDCSQSILAQDQFFSPLGGGAVCPKCGGSRAESWPVTSDVLRYLRHFQRSTWGQLERVDIPNQIEPELADLITRYITYLLERKLNTPAFLQDIQANRHPQNSS